MSSFVKFKIILTFDRFKIYLLVSTFFIRHDTGIMAVTKPPTHTVSNCFYINNNSDWSSDKPYGGFIIDLVGVSYNYS